MVKTLSHTDKEALATAVAEAEHKTSAEVVAVVAAASDPYSSFVMLYGLMAGSLAATGVSLYQPATGFPPLLALQLITVSLFSLIPPLRHLCICLVPKTVRHHRAAHRVYAEYLRVSHHVHAATPIVLFYVSLAERYVHILPSRMVREAVPNAHWEEIVREFTSVLPKEGLKKASIDAVTHMADKLAAHFPPDGKAHSPRHPVIEMGKD